MFTNLINAIPSIRESISYLFDYYLGIKLNLSNFTIDNNTLFIQLTNINIDASRINLDYLKNINIKLTKGIIEKIEIRVGLNTLEIKISKLSVRVMPVIELNHNENKEESEIKNEIEEKKEEKVVKIEKDKNQDDNNQKGYITSFVEHYLSKLKVSVNEIELLAFNYEIINKNLTYANPVISFYIYNINYTDGEIDETNNENYIRKNIWENKHFSIGGICLKISKSYKPNQNLNEEKNNNNNKKEKEATSVIGDTKPNNIINFDKDNNDNIMLINTDKGIHFYTNTKNEILGDIGDIQLVINLFQLELLKNFIDTYSLYLNNDNNKKNNNKKSENNNNNNINKINEEKNNYKNDTDTSITTSSSVIAKSNNEIMNLKIKLNSFSIVLLERNQNPTEVKFYEFNKDKMQEHFCYFESNFFIFIIYDVCLTYDNKKKLISFTINDITLNYIEYISKTKKEEEIELVARTGSEYSECNENLIFKSNEMFRSMADDSNLFNVKEYYCSYDYKYSKNQIILIKNINLGFNYANENKKKAVFELNSFNVNFHPILLFKVLKILYENSFLIREVLFFNLQQLKKEEKYKNEIDKEKEKEIDSNNNIDKDKNIKKDDDERINLSFLSCEEDEEEDNKKKIKIILII